jgi:polyisoprenoid-binding protein YceI
MKLRATFPAALVAAGLAFFALVPSSRQGETSVQPLPVRDAGAQAIRLTVAQDGNEARYRVREQLARVEFPSDAIGRTNAVTGTIAFEPNGTIAKDASRFTIDLTTLKSNSDRRDNFIRRRALETEAHPTATFAPTAFRSLPDSLPASGDVYFQLIGDMTVHGVTKPVTWTVVARAEDGTYTGNATTSFNFAYFEMEIPRVASVLSVVDSITLEYDFKLIPAR